MSKKPLKLQLACGQIIPNGFTGVDIAPLDGVEYVGDLLDFWSPDSVWKKIKDNSVDEIRCDMFVEHIPHIIEGHDMKWGRDDCFFLFFDEVHRVLKPAEFNPNNPNIPTKGFAKIVTPYYSSMRAWQDPTHYRAISEASYLYLNKTWRKENKLDHYPVSCDFNYTFSYNIDGALVNRNEEYQMNAVRTQINSALDIEVTLTKK